MSEFAPLLVDVLVVLVLSFAVRLLVQRVRDLAYASALVSVGLLVSLLGVSLDLHLSHDLIIVVLLPVLIFEGTIELDLAQLRSDLPLILVLTVVGLPASVLLLGAIGTVAFGFPLLIALLFASIILPTDPAAVIALFEAFDAPDRLSVAMEGESLLNDGVAIVIFSTLFEAFRTSESSSGSLGDLADPTWVLDLVGNVAVIGGGGFLVGAGIGYVAHRLVRRTDDRMAGLLLTVIVAYGSFLVAEQYFGVSGVLATVGAGLLLGAHDEIHPGNDARQEAVESLWSVAAFFVSTLLYVLIGASVDIGDFVRYGELVVAAAVLVVVVRGVVTYPLLSTVNRVLSDPVPLYCQNIFVWGGLHTVVPVALVLSLPEGTPHLEAIRTMVFGVAIIGILVQGVLMPTILRRTGLAEG